MEIEFKFIVPAERLEAVEAALQSAPCVVTPLQAYYFDTPESTLATAEVAWRVRREGDLWVQTVKAPGRSPLEREEHNVALADFSAANGLPDPDLHRGTVAGDRLIEALGAASHGVIRTYETRISRLTRSIAVQGGVAELALDTGQVVAHPGTPQCRQAGVCELELELKSGAPAALVQEASKWVREHGLYLSTISKAERGERLMAGHPARPATKASAMSASGALPAGQALQQRVVANVMEQVTANASEIAEGSGDQEHVHQLRVGLRRLRTALRELDMLAPGAFDAAWQAPLTHTCRRLGNLRDQEAVLETVGARLNRAGGPRIGRLKRADASAEQIVRYLAFQTTLVSLLGFAAGGPTDAASHAESLDAEATRRALRRRLRKRVRQMRQGSRVFHDLPPNEQHRLRKRLKRLRYVTEFLAPALQGGGARFLKRLKPAQKSLGTLNDEQVAEDVYRTIAEDDPKAWFGVGWLIARRKPLVDECQRALRRIDDGPRVRKKGFR